VQKYLSFSELPPQFDAFFIEQEKRSVFFSRAWFERLYEHFLPSPSQLRLYGLELDEQIVGLFVAVSLSAGQKPAGLSELQTIQGFTTTQSFRSALLLRDDNVDRIPDIAVLVRALREDEESFDCIDVDLLCVDDATSLAWVSALRDEGFLCHLELQEWNRYEDVSEIPFSKIAKKSTKRRERKLGKELKLRFEMYTSPEDMPKAQEAYEDIYRRTWKQADVARQFAADLICDFAKRDWVRFLVLYGDERPLAAECFFVHGNIASSFRTAYDLNYRDFSVGSIVLQRMLEHVMTIDNVLEIDFGPGDEPYKKQWLSKRRKLWRIRAYHTGRLRARVTYGLRILEDELERAKETRLGRWLRTQKGRLRPRDI